MTTITQFLKMNIGSMGVDEAAGCVSAKITLQKISEAFWGILSFALFLLLGPFSIIAAICSVVSMAKQCNGVEPEAMG